MLSIGQRYSSFVRDYSQNLTQSMVKAIRSGSELPHRVTDIEEAWQFDVQVVFGAAVSATGGLRSRDLARLLPVLQILIKDINASAINNAEFSELCSENLTNMAEACSNAEREGLLALYLLNHSDQPASKDHASNWVRFLMDVAAFVPNSDPLKTACWETSKMYLSLLSISAAPSIAI